MASNISQAIKVICDEKGIPYENVLETVKAALAAAYRKDFGNKLQNIQVEFDPETGKLEAFDVKTVVEDVPEEELLTLETQYAERELKTTEAPKEKPKEKPEGEALAPAHAEGAPAEGTEEPEKKRFNPKTEIQIKDAKTLKKTAKIGDVIRTQLEVPGEFGRMAAQTAKQVIIQKLREAEREIIYNEYKNKERVVLVGVVQRREGRMVLVDLGRATALMPPDHQIPREMYVPGDHLKVMLVAVNKTAKGPEIIVSRAHEDIVKKFFEMEIPEIASGAVQIKGIAREAGSRTKIAVFTEQENIDPIGSCIGQRGARVQTIISELKGEKIDIIEYSDNPETYIGNALSPAKISGIKLDSENKVATVSVAEDQLSLAIGRNGQNVRLAARLTGWRIDIVTAGGEKKEPAAEQEAGGEKKEVKEEAQKPEEKKPEEVKSEDAKKEEATKPEKTEEKNAKKEKTAEPEKSKEKDTKKEETPKKEKKTKKKKSSEK